MQTTSSQSLITIVVSNSYCSQFHFIISKLSLKRACMMIAIDIDYVFIQSVLYS